MRRFYSVISKLTLTSLTGVTAHDEGNYHLGLFDEAGNFLACHMMKVKLLEAPPPEKDHNFRFANRMAMLDKKAAAAR